MLIRTHAYAFSLLELMISMMILAVAILLTLGIFMSGVKGSQKGQDLSAGVLVAKSVLNEEMLKIQTGAGTISSATFFSQDTPTITGQRVVGTTTFDYEIRHSLVNDIGGTPIGDGLPLNRVKKVDILVTWTDNPGDSSVGQGLLKVGHSKFINQRAFQ